MKTYNFKFFEALVRIGCLVLSICGAGWCWGKTDEEVAKEAEIKAQAHTIMIQYGGKDAKVLTEDQLQAYVRDQSSPFKDMKAVTYSQIPPNTKEKYVPESEVQSQALIAAKAMGDKYGTVQIDAKYTLSEAQLAKEMGSKPPDSWFNENVAKYISVANSFANVANTKDPARFSYAYAASKSSYSLDLGLKSAAGVPLGADSIGDVNYTADFAPSVEAHIGNLVKDQADQLDLRGTFELDVTPKTDPGWTGQTLLLAPNFQSDKEFLTETFGTDALYTISSDELGMGERRPIGKTGLSFSWRPYFGFEGGTVLNDDGPTKLNQDDFIRMIFKLHGELWMTKAFVLSADYTFRANTIDNNNCYQYVEVSPILYLDSDRFFSIGATYKDGATTPTFKSIDSLNLWLGVKF